MNNLIDFAEYQRRARLYEESLVSKQILKPLVEEGLFKGLEKKINKRGTEFVKAALKDEIEMGERLQKEITEAINELKDYIDKIQKEVDDSHKASGEFFEKIQKIFKDIEKASFNLMTLLGGTEINFSDYIKNAAMANMVNYGVMFIPKRNVFLLKKSYKYFIGLIKNTIRRDLLMLQLNFDQFENTVLIESLDEDAQSKLKEKMDVYLEAIDDAMSKLLGNESTKAKGKVTNRKSQKEVKDTLMALKQGMELKQKYTTIWNNRMGLDPYGNTYTRTLEQLKNFVLEDDAKYLDAITKGMRELAIDEIDTKSYVELLIDAAEECAYEVSNAIHNNFLSMISVFKLSNQKRLVDLVKKDNDLFEKKQKELEDEAKRKFDEDELKKKKEKIDKYGLEIFKKLVKEARGEDQVKSFKDLEKEKGDSDGSDDDTYNEEEIVLQWLQMDNNANWEKYKDGAEGLNPITKLLRLYLTGIVGTNGNHEDYLTISENLGRFLLDASYIETKKSGIVSGVSVATPKAKVEITDDADGKKNCGFTIFDIENEGDSDEKEVENDLLVNALKKLIVDTTKTPVGRKFERSASKTSILKEMFNIFEEDEKVDEEMANSILNVLELICKNGKVVIKEPRLKGILKVAKYFSNGYGDDKDDEEESKK